MQITDVKIRKLLVGGSTKAVVSVTFDGQLAVHDIKVVSTGGKFFVSMPRRKAPDGRFRDTVHPICPQFRAELERAVLEAFAVALSQVGQNDRTDT